MSSDSTRRPNTVVNHNGVTIATLVCRNVPEAESVRGVGDELLRIIDEQGRRKVLLNLTDIEFMSGDFLGKVFKLHTKLQVVRGKLVLVGVPEGVRDVLRITKFDQILTIVGTEAEAEAIFDAMPTPPAPTTPPQPDPVLTSEDIRQIEADGLTLGDAIRKVEALAE